MGLPPMLVLIHVVMHVQQLLVECFLAFFESVFSLGFLDSICLSAPRARVLLAMLARL